MKLPRLAFEILREIGDSLRGQKILIACSGGLDSIALVDVLMKIAPRLDLELGIAHIHHGPGSNKNGRDVACKFVRAFAENRGVPFFVRTSERELKSEEDLRQFRLESLRELAENFDRVALGHHADDLLETRLMRLIRGTGPRGLVSMRRLSKQTVRPFLKRARAEIETYARSQNLDWVEDPSNSETTYFRNWIRHEWLPSLEAKRPGSKVALTRSLDLLSEAVPSVTNTAKVSPKFGRKDFERLPDAAKKEFVLAVVNDQGLRDFGQTKITEVLKRLNRLELSRQKNATFNVGGVEWCVTSDAIVASRRHSANAGPRS